MRAVIFCCEIEAEKETSMSWHPSMDFTHLYKRYKKRGIQGVVTYSNGRLIHFLEGKNSNIRKALSEAFIDPSFNHFDFCLNVPAHVKAFNDWRMVYPAQLKKDRLFSDFIGTYQDSIKPPRDSYRAISSLSEKYQVEMLLN